jgi:hypothetical protein
MCELALNQHLHDHMVEYPFTSDLCNERFMLNSDCNGHIHTYIGELGNILTLLMCISRLSHFKLPISSTYAIVLGNRHVQEIICMRVT